MNKNPIQNPESLVQITSRSGTSDGSFEQRKSRLDRIRSTTRQCLLAAIACGILNYAQGQQFSVAQSTPADPTARHLAWNADRQRFDAHPGELLARFTFYVTNISDQTVIITNLVRSCGCTEALMPAQPWVLAPGTNGPIQATIDLRGKSGMITKQLTVQSSVGWKVLVLEVNIPLPASASQPTNSPPKPAAAKVEMNRERSMELATLDRQAVFKGDCASCHAMPTAGKLGHELYQAGCAICHEAENRAAMVPDLHALKQALTALEWKQWIADSKPGSFMPAFAMAHGGPLTDEQITSLVDYLSRTFGAKS
jgi:mono/diheme cytochrome c family protein